MSIDFILEKAFFIHWTGREAEVVAVHFNPVSLQHSITNTLKNEGKGNKKKQYIGGSAGKLTMELVFDTTGDGADVREHTKKIARFMEPLNGGKKKVPAVVEFRWGVYSFKGMVEAYRELFDFFSPTGVPLRAVVNLTMARQDLVFDFGDTSSTFDTRGALEIEPVEIPCPPSAPGEEGAGGQSAASAAALAGDPGAGREIAAENGQESMRFGEGPSLVVSDSVELKKPETFTDGQAGAGPDIGAPAGGGPSLEPGALSGAAAGSGGGPFLKPGALSGAVDPAGVGGGDSFGGRASAGVSASEGAFSGLRRPARRIRRAPGFDPSRLVRRNESFGLTTDGEAEFRLGGRAVSKGPGSLKADVGASANLNSRIRFEED
ncbi:MAG: hypothetical protein GY859_33465 [Desulfobacterales bacterium]|nr:hypothetical protein [Desulfobacterales bacterium]